MWRGRCPTPFPVSWTIWADRMKGAIAPCTFRIKAVRERGLVTLWCRRPQAASEQMSTGHLHSNVRVPPISKNWDTPKDIPVFWCEYSYRTFRKSAPYQHFLSSDRFQFDPHPYGMRLKLEGLSHGLKTVHRTVFTAAFAAAALSSPARQIKNGSSRMG